MDLRVCAQACDVCGGAPQVSRHGDAAQGSPVTGCGGIFRAGQTQAGFTPDQLFAAAPIRSNRGQDHDGDHAPVELSDQRGGSLFGWRHVQRADLRSMLESLLAHLPGGHVQTVVFQHARGGAPAALPMDGAA